MQRKVVAAATRGRSYEDASADLKELAELDLSAKRCGRIAQRIGRERLEERQQRCRDFAVQPLAHRKDGAPASAPANSWNSRVAVVIVDGGRAQVRDERWGTPKAPGERRSWWREPKIGCVTTFASTPSAVDPLPEIPASLLDPLFVIPRVLEMKRTRSAPPVTDPAPCSPSAAAEKPALPASTPQRWSPEPLVQTVVGTFAGYQALGELLEVETWHRGFACAPRRAFLADGLLANWTLHQERFSHYTPIVDLMHAIAYVYTAAVESSPDVECCWQRYSAWITQVWQGRVSQWLPELAALTAASTAEKREKLAECLTYLTHNASRMKYADYRRAGLPLTTVLAESKMKQINRRMKGTEKFWQQGKEPQLQLCCDYYSDLEPLDAFWKRRADRQTGFRKPRKALSHD